MWVEQSEIRLLAEVMGKNKNRGYQKLALPPNQWVNEKCGSRKKMNHGRHGERLRMRSVNLKEKHFQLY